MGSVALTQGAYYLVSGVWPLIHMDSFVKVTGPKADMWLVRTVGLLLAAIGGGLVLAALSRQFAPGLALIALGSAAALLLIELVHVLKRVISPIYLADAAVELGFLVWWAVSLGQG